MGQLNRQRVIFKTIFYLVTLVSLGLLAWALRQAHSHLDIATVLWIVIYIVIAVYFVKAIAAIRKRRGFNLFIAHLLTLQLIPLCVAITILSLIPEAEVTESVAPAKEVAQREEIIFDPAQYKPLAGKPSDYDREFNDMQDKQKAAAIKNGLATFSSRADIEAKYAQLQREGKLVHISTNPSYIVRDLTYSSPYVVPKMAKLLDDIARNFQMQTCSRSQFEVTSALRTEEDIAKLKRKNGNASSDSCHCNATTVDISYTSFGIDSVNVREAYQLRLALAKTLQELRKEGRCYIKKERKQYCYHITVR